MESGDALDILVAFKRRGQGWWDENAWTTARVQAGLTTCGATGLGVAGVASSTSQTFAPCSTYEIMLH